MQEQTIITINRLDDPRLMPYQSLTDRELAADGVRFIAQGAHVVERLLDSGLACESVLLTPRAYDRLIPLVPPGVPVYRMSMELAMQVVGFKFHTGALAVGLRPSSPTLAQIAAHDTLVICPQLNVAENLGSIIRSAVSLGAGGLIVGSRCTDPYYRRTVRVSMGSIFAVPVMVADDMVETISALRNEYSFDVLASVLDPAATNLRAYRRRQHVALVLGSEDQGLDAATTAACSHQVTIPMQPGQDSLSVAIAGGIMLYQLQSTAIN